jgi:hypothetical protein
MTLSALICKNKEFLIMTSNPIAISPSILVNSLRKLLLSGSKCTSIIVVLEMTLILPKMLRNNIHYLMDLKNILQIQENRNSILIIEKSMIMIIQFTEICVED